VKLPALSADDRSRTPAAAYVMAYAEEARMSDDQRRQAIQAYQATISLMDAQVGRVLDAVERLGLAQNTIVIFSSDHGYHLGDHGLWQKRSLFERSARVPLIIAVPGTRAAGRTAGAPVELLDLYPTLAALTGQAPPGYLDGLSLRPMLENPDASIRPAAITQTLVGQNITGYSARTTRWRYTEWTGPDGKPAGSQLFDESADPMETKNVVADPANAKVVEELAALIAPVRARR
jgi:arylsulfatase A-like enzyme